MIKNISKNITYIEAIRSQTATKYNIPNIPNDKQLENMIYLAENIFQPIREHFNTPIGISSFFRSIPLNKKIGGSETSQHCKGEAIDLDADTYGHITNSQIFTYIINNLEFDQIIWEFGNKENPNWVHVSYSKSFNRNKILLSKYVGNKTVYEAWSPNES